MFLNVFANELAGWLWAPFGGAEYKPAEKKMDRS